MKVRHTRCHIYVSFKDEQKFCSFLRLLNLTASISKVALTLVRCRDCCMYAGKKTLTQRIVMKARFSLGAGVLILAAALVGCGGTESSKSEGVSDPFSESSVSSPNQKAYLASAKCGDVKPHVHGCGHGVRCVEVCHRPPGNPANQKTIALPLAATAAHMHHGKHHHGHMDYLGPCRDDGDDSSSDDSSSDDSSSDDDGDTTPPPADPGNGGTTSGGGASDPASHIPPWCAPFVSFDANCDGLNDSTGEAYL